MTRANDKLDRQLVALLQVNARESTTSLAKKLAVARTTIQERITRLETNGTIIGYSAILSRDPFETYTQAIIMLGLSHGRLKEVVDKLRTFPEIKLCQSVNGDFELLCRVEVPHVEDLDALLDEIGSLGGIERFKSWVILATRFDRRDRELSSASRLHAAALSRGEAG